MKKPVLSSWGTLKPRTFDQVIGRSSVVRALQERVQTGTHSMPLILHGPEGVGKLMLARLYAKATLCSNPDPSGSSCNRCELCSEFDKVSTWDYIERAGSPYLEREQDEKMATFKARTINWVRALRDSISTPPKYGWRVVVLGQADSYPDEAFDVLLKVLEEQKHMQTTLVFLAGDLTKVRRAARSRCFSYRVAPLVLEDVESLIQTLAAADSSICNGRALKMLSHASAGLPGKAKRDWMRVSATGECSLSDIRCALELDWVDGAACYWSALLADEGPSASTLQPHRDRHLGEQVRRARVFLTRVGHYLEASPTPPELDPAFLFLDRDPAIDVAHSLLTRAVLCDRDPLQLWRELAHVWLSSDIIDSLGFFEAGRRSYDLVR